MPTVVATGAFIATAGNITPALPAGIQADDVLVYFIETANEAVTVDAAWTEAPSSPVSYASGNLVRLTVFWARYNGSSINRTTSGVTDHAAGQIIAIRGCPTSGSLWNVTNNGPTGTATSYTINGATTTAVNCMVLVALGLGRDAASSGSYGFTNSDLANLTVRMEATTNAGSGGGIAMATGEKAAKGAYGITSVSFGVSQEYAGWTGALIGA